MTNRQTIAAFIAQRAAQAVNNNRSLLVKGKKIFSYGEHYVLGVLSGMTLTVNTRHYSQTTSKHQSQLISAACREGLTIKRKEM